MKEVKYIPQTEGQAGEVVVPRKGSAESRAYFFEANLWDGGPKLVGQT